MATKKKIKKGLIISLSVIGSFLLILFSAFMFQVGFGGSYTDSEGKYKHINTSSSYNYIYNHPIWEGNGEDLFSCWADESTTKLTGFMSVKALSYWCGWDANTIVDSLNYLIDQANENRISIHQVYSESEILQKDYLKTTKMVFYKGNPNMPTAIVAAGGGYTTVCSNIEGFPYAWKLHERGYNVFVLRYRVGQDLSLSGNKDIVSEAGKDMIAAIKYIQDNKSQLGVSLDNYSLWGSSAGGGIITSFSYACQDESFEQLKIPKPAAQMLIYTHADYFNLLKFQKDDVPTYTIVGCGDTYGGDIVMDKKVPEMQAAQMIVEYHKYEDYAHGMGLGIGTSAEGWIDDAMAFWQKQIEKNRKLIFSEKGEEYGRFKTTKNSNDLQIRLAF